MKVKLSVEDLKAHADMAVRYFNENRKTARDTGEINVPIKPTSSAMAEQMYTVMRDTPYFQYEPLPYLRFKVERTTVKGVQAWAFFYHDVLMAVAV